MSQTHYNRGSRRHAGVNVRTTHGYDPLSAPDPEERGISFSEARDGEQLQSHDLGPGVVLADHVTEGALSRELFAAGVRPPIVVDALPTLPDDAYEPDDYAFLTTDSTLWKVSADGTAWEEEDGSTITNGTMIGGLVRAAAISADQIAANAIQTQHFQATARAPGVENDPADPVNSEVIIDPDGITIRNGKIHLLDPYGASVLEAAGFAGSWSRFIESGVYNNNFGGTIGPLAVTEVNDGLGADYEASLSTLLPYWVIETIGANKTLELVQDGTLGQPYLSATSTSDTTSEIVLYQDVPITPGVPMGAVIRWATHMPAAVVHPVRLQVGVSYVDANHENESAVTWGYGKYTDSVIMQPFQFYMEATEDRYAFARVRIRLSEFHATQASGISLFDISVKPRQLWLDTLYLKHTTSNDNYIPPSITGDDGSIQFRGTPTQLVLHDYSALDFGVYWGAAVGRPRILGNAINPALLIMEGGDFRIGSDSYGLQLGALGDVALSRGAANRLDLASGDAFNIVLGALQMRGVDFLTLLDGNSKGAGDTGPSFPQWISLMNSTDTAATWPSHGRGILLTIRANDQNTYQFWMPRTSSGGVAATQVWARGWENSGGSWRAWVALH